MKLISKALVLLTILSPPPNQSLAQTGSGETSQYLTRIQLITRIDAVTHDDCIAVFVDGTFRREHWILNPRILESGSPGAKTRIEPSTTVKVFEGRISGDELTKLQDLLDSSGLRNISSTPPSTDRHFLKDELLSLSIHRSTGNQRLMFFDKESRAPYQEELAPVLHWFSKMQRYPAQGLSGNQSSRCQVSTK